MKNKSKIKNLQDRKSIRESVTKISVDELCNTPRIIEHTAHIDFNDKNLDNVRFPKVNSTPAVGEHLAAKNYVHQAISNCVGEPTLVKINQDNDFNNFTLANMNSITLNIQAVHDNHFIIKSFIDQFCHENEQSRRNLGIDFYDESSDLVKNSQNNNFNENNLSNLDSITVNRDSISKNELADKKYVDESLCDG